MAVKLTKSKYIKGVHPSETPLGIYKDADTKDLRVFDEKGNIESINAITIPGPQGPQGVAGPIGPTGASGINWMGTWDSETTYAANDAVFYDGSSYFASGASTDDFPDDGAPWYPLAIQGATGPQGPQGPQGLSGTSVYTESQVQESSANISSLNFLTDQYYASVGVQTYTNKFVYKVDLTTSVDLIFPNSDDGDNGSHPLKFWFEMVPPSGSSFNQFDFFTVHYQSNFTSGSLWYDMNNNPTFSIAQGNRSNGNIYLLFQAAAGTLADGVYTIVYHKVV